MKEFFPGYFTALGVNNSKAIQDNVDCQLNYMNLLELVGTASNQFSKNLTVEEKVRLIQNLVFTGVKLYDSCHAAFTFNWEHFNGPIIEAFQNAPVHVVVAIVHNIAVNLPEILQNRIDLTVALLEGDYFGAGRMGAEELVTIFRNIIF